MDKISLFIIFAEVMLAIFMLTFSIFLLLPRAVNCFNKWVLEKKNQDFSHAIFYIFVSCSLSSYVGIELITNTLKLETHFASEYIKLITFIISTFILVYLLIPKSLFFFKNGAFLKNRLISQSLFFLHIHPFIS